MSTVSFKESKQSLDSGLRQNDNTERSLLEVNILRMSWEVDLREYDKYF